MSPSINKLPQLLSARLIVNLLLLGAIVVGGIESNLDSSDAPDTRRSTLSNSANASLQNQKRERRQLLTLPNPFWWGPPSLSLPFQGQIDPRAISGFPQSQIPPGFFPGLIHQLRIPGISGPHPPPPPGNGFTGFGLNQIPGASNQKYPFHHQFIQFQPGMQPKPQQQPLPANPGGSRPPQGPMTPCRTMTGNMGHCMEFRKCFPLLFTSREDEERNYGLSNILRDSSGVCRSSFSGWFSKPSEEICCANDEKRPSGGVPPGHPGPRPTVIVTTAAPMTTTTTTPRPNPWVNWPRPSQSAPTFPPPSPARDENKVELYNCARFRIIGGIPVSGRPYPFIASIKNGQTGRHICGGSLISPRSVLTAAHCVAQLGAHQVSTLRVHMGSNDISASPNSKCSVVRRVKNVRYHRGFSMRTLHDDIAILTLDSPVPLGDTIQTVSLSPNRIEAGNKATVVGWGGIQLGGQPVANLRHVNLDIIRNDVCAAKYRGSAPGGITHNMMCAGSPGRDACLGDSGGPIIMNGQQIGIVSFGTGCGTLPGVYSRVSSYLHWINKNKF